MSADIIDLGVCQFLLRDPVWGWVYLLREPVSLHFHGIVLQSCEDGYVLSGLGAYHVQPGDFCADCYGKPLVQKTHTRIKWESRHKMWLPASSSQTPASTLRPSFKVAYSVGSLSTLPTWAVFSYIPTWLYSYKYSDSLLFCSLSERMLWNVDASLSFIVCQGSNK